MANTRDFPGSPVVKTFQCGVYAGLIPGQGTKTPHALGPKHQNIRQKQYCNKFNKDFKSHPHKKKKNLKENGQHKIPKHEGALHRGEKIHVSNLLLASKTRQLGTQILNPSLGL